MFEISPVAKCSLNITMARYNMLFPGKGYYYVHIFPECKKKIIIRSLELEKSSDNYLDKSLKFSSQVGKFILNPIQSHGTTEIS